MSLRQQFALLITGILLVPFLTLVVAVGIFQLSSTAEQMVFGLRKDSALIADWLATDRSKPLTGLVNDNIAIFDEQNNVIFGNEQNLSIQQLTTEFDAVSVWLGPEDNSAQTVHLFTRNNLEGLDGPPLTIILIPAVLLVFVASMSIWIIRTIQRRLKNLVSSTERIGNGDLNTAVFIQGHDELARFSQSLDTMRVQLKQAGEDRKRLLMGVSHDLKTPLAGIKGYVQAMLDGLATDKDKQTEYLNIVSNKSDLLERRVSSLIEYVKLETSDWLLEATENNVHALTEQWFQEFKNDLVVSGFNCTIQNQLPLGDSCQFDPTLVRRALDNLISNAMKHASQGSQIILTASVDQTHYHYTVENEGESFTKSEQQSLFKPFFRVDKGRNTEGLGLGLTVVEKVAQLHGGEVSYQFDSGKHLFSILVPK